MQRLKMIEWCTNIIQHFRFTCTNIAHKMIERVGRGGKGGQVVVMHVHCGSSLLPAAPPPMQPSRQPDTSSWPHTHTTPPPACLAYLRFFVPWLVRLVGRGGQVPRVRLPHLLFVYAVFVGPAAALTWFGPTVYASHRSTHAVLYFFLKLFLAIWKPLQFLFTSPRCQWPYIKYPSNWPNRNGSAETHSLIRSFWVSESSVCSHSSTHILVKDLGSPSKTTTRFFPLRGPLSGNYFAKIPVAEMGGTSPPPSRNIANKICNKGAKKG